MRYCVQNGQPMTTFGVCFQEGLLNNIRDKLLESNLFNIGDSSYSSEKSRFDRFMEQLNQV
jgi:hypothetical protein